MSGSCDLHRSAAFLGFCQMTAEETPGFFKRDETNASR
jgi:hypothetical protein